MIQVGCDVAAVHGDHQTMSESKNRRIRDANGGPGTLISANCRIEGRITGRGHFMISGAIEGECDIDGTVTLAKEGHWRGTIKADSVVIAGSVDGDIQASSRVEIGDTGRVSGTVSSAAIAVAEGAVIEGHMQTTAQEAPTEFVEKRLPEEG
jgi:cytoskeletal protein CcmA (bactofilin family)